MKWYLIDEAIAFLDIREVGDTKEEALRQMDEAWKDAGYDGEYLPEYFGIVLATMVDGEIDRVYDSVEVVVEGRRAA